MPLRYWAPRPCYEPKHLATSYLGSAPGVDLGVPLTKVGHGDALLLHNSVT